MQRVAQADIPRLSGSALAGQLDVTAAVDGVIAAAVARQELAGAFDRPTFDEPGRVDAFAPMSREANEP